jgi:hypothetical protein
MTREQKRRLVILLLRFNPSEVHHGCCTGADDQANTIAREALGLYTVGHPPTNPTLMFEGTCDEWRRVKDYLERDRDIVDETDCLIATPKTDTDTGGGTWYTVNYAVKQGKRVFLIKPNGRMEVL